MTNKTLNTLTKKYDPNNMGPFEVLGSEILFYPALDALEYYYKNILLDLNPLRNIKDEGERACLERESKMIDHLKKITKENIELGKAIINDADCQRYHFDRVELFLKNYANILIFVEEIPA